MFLGCRGWPVCCASRARLVPIKKLLDSYDGLLSAQPNVNNYHAKWFCTPVLIGTAGVKLLHQVSSCKYLAVHPRRIIIHRFGSGKAAVKRVCCGLFLFGSSFDSQFFWSLLRLLFNTSN